MTSGPAMNFIRYATATYGDGRPVVVINGSAFFDPDYIKACLQRALDGGKLTAKAQKMARNLL
jgi:hypothetical protein